MPEKSYGYLLSLIAGIVTIFLTFIIAFISGRIYHSLMGQLIKGEIFTLLWIILAVHLVCGTVMILGGLLIERDHHFLGSSLVLSVSIIGLFTGAGIILGPILGGIGAIIGFEEEFK